MFAKFQKAFLGLAMLAGVAVASEAQAQTFTFQGTTTGSFSGTAVPGLTFNNGSFNADTSDGFLAIGGGGVNFGSFTAAGTPGSATGSSFFTLTVNFTLPVGTTPNSTNYQTTVIGSVTKTNQGGYAIAFDSAPRTFQFNGGEFVLSVFPTGVTAGQTNSISGYIIAAPGPIAGTGIPVAVLGVIVLMHVRGRRRALEV